MMRDACLISGGMDSSALAQYAKNRDYEICALYVNYGQRTEKKGRACAKKIALLPEARDDTGIDLRHFGKPGAIGWRDPILYEGD